MKKNINNLIIRFPFGPVIVFGLGGVMAFWGLYFTHGPGPKIALAFGMFLLALFLVFLFCFRSADRVAIGAAGPVIVGPLMANIYVKYRAPELAPILDQGGDTLIQLAFFFASLFGSVAYMFTMFSETEAPHWTKKAKVYLGFLVAVFFICMFLDLSSQNGRPGPAIDILQVVHPPRLTGLTVCRLLLALLSVVTAAWPDPPKISILAGQPAIK